MHGCDYLFTIEASENSGPVHVPSCLGVTDYANSSSTKVDIQATQVFINGTRTGSEDAAKKRRAPAPTAAKCKSKVRKPAPKPKKRSKLDS